MLKSAESRLFAHLIRSNSPSRLVHEVRGINFPAYRLLSRIGSRGIGRFDIVKLRLVLQKWKFCQE